MNTINQAFPRTTHDLYDLDDSRRCIEVYDDEQPGHLTLYYSDGERRHGIRSISLADPTRAADILAAWGERDEKMFLMSGSRTVAHIGGVNGEAHWNWQSIINRAADQISA